MAGMATSQQACTATYSRFERPRDCGWRLAANTLRQGSYMIDRMPTTWLEVCRIV